MSKVVNKVVNPTKVVSKVKSKVLEPELTLVVEPENELPPTPPESLREESIKDRFDVLIENRRRDRQRIQDEIQELKKLYKEHSLEVKNASKKKKKVINKQKRQPSGFAKPQKLDERLYDFLEGMGVEKGQEIARTKVTTMIHEYIKKNNLKNPEYKQEFFPDKKLKDLLGEPLQWRDVNDHSKGKMYATMGIQVYMKPYFPKVELKK